MDNLIITVGTSLIDNYIKINGEKEKITKEMILDYYENIESFRDMRFGAEIIAVENLREKNIFSGKRLFMINHDTKNGVLAAEVLEEFFIKKGIVQEVIRKTIPYVDKRRPIEFKTKGLKNLVEEIGNIVDSVKNRYNIAVCTVGGYTAEIFIVSLMAQILGVESYFMFREFEEITQIQPLPIQLDYNYYLANKEFFRILGQNQEVLKSEIQKYLDSEIHLNYFIEEIKKDCEIYATLSAIGYYYYKTVTDYHDLPRRHSTVPINQKELPSMSIKDVPFELTELINELKACPYVNKLKIVFHNPNRTLKVSKFILLDSDDYESAIALEFRSNQGGYRVDIITVASTTKEQQALMVYFNEVFL